MSNIALTLLLALIAGLIPALLWLWFWLHEDNSHPEPRSIIASVFLGGMGMTIVAIILESIASKFAVCAPTPTHTCIFIWAAIEELLKFYIAAVLALQTVYNDEPLDSVIYMMCAALGFAALENALFIFTPLSSGIATATIFTLNLRFIGATLLHTLTSSTIGVFLAFTFFKSRSTKLLAGTAGVIIAIILHTWFNLSIIEDNNNGIFFTFFLVWLAIVGLILILERVKTIVNITK